VDDVLVTGATGLIGANICKLLREQGRSVRALVRPGSEVEPLAALGVQLVEGDITEPDDVKRAAGGAGAIINSAALLGGPDQDRDALWKANYEGSIHCYDAGKREGVRVVEMATTTFFEHERPLTESSALLTEVDPDPYTTSKHAAYREAARREQAGEQDILFVTPGGAFGPAPTPKRALAMTSFNRAVRGAVNGKIQSYLSYPVPWVRAEDVASVAVAAIDRGVSGQMYLAFGQEDAMTTAAFLNIACEAAGVEYRVAETPVNRDDPEMVGRFGDTLINLASRKYPVPWFDNKRTRDQFGYAPISLPEALQETVTWLRSLGQV
jgi:nucleoside-diphosphate-sugar epimerase